jgi:hypothetical protein
MTSRSLLRCLGNDKPLIAEWGMTSRLLLRCLGNDTGHHDIKVTSASSWAIRITIPESEGVET